MQTYRKRNESAHPAPKLIVSLFFLVATFFLPAIAVRGEVSGAGFEPPTLYVMNSPLAKSRIEKGFFNPVFRGFGQRTALRIAQNELIGFHFLFDTDCLSTTLLAMWRKNQEQGMSAEQALRKAKEDHLACLKQEFARMASLANLYENYPGKDVEPEYHFLFSTPYLPLARSYGSVIMVIEELQPRGLDLNGIGQDSKYYSIARALKNLAKIHLKTILSDYVADRDEYVIPSFITPDDVTGLIVYEPSPVVILKKIPLIPPKVRRVYRKHQIQGTMVIDVFDGQDRLIERLSSTPWAFPPDPSIKKSTEKLPEAISVAWKSYVAKRRRPSAK
ncbi:MAG: hypothetical protein WA705_02980 [Candidatus Ozemobacteraceae bacterium]